MSRKFKRKKTKNKGYAIVFFAWEHDLGCIDPFPKSITPTLSEIFAVE